MHTTTRAPLTAYRIHRSDGSSYITDMAAGVTLAQARAFIGSTQYLDDAETQSLTVVNVTTITPPAAQPAARQGDLFPATGYGLNLL